MAAANNIAKDIDSPEELDDGTLEMILFLTQKAISDLKELHQRNVYAPSNVEDYMGSGYHKDSPEGKIQQVKNLSSNAYELINTLEQMKRTRDEKAEQLQKQSKQLREAVKIMLKDIDHHRVAAVSANEPQIFRSSSYHSTQQRNFELNIQR